MAITHILCDENVYLDVCSVSSVSVIFAAQLAKSLNCNVPTEYRLIMSDCYCCIGYPAPDMKWYHVQDGGLRPIIDDDKHRINQLLSHGQVLMISESWYQLTIINVQANDYGIYICEGTNKYGSDQLEIQIYGKSVKHSQSTIINATK